MRTKQIAALLFLTAFVTTSGSLHARNCRPNPNHCGETELQESIPLKIYRNFWVIAEGKVAGSSGRQNFILDTGTAPSIINAGLATELGLATQPSKSTVVGKTIPMQTAISPAIELGPIHAVSLPVYVQDLKWLERNFRIPIAGILGLDVLTKSSFRLDYEKSVIEFGEISRVGIPVHLDPFSGLAVAEMSLGGKALRMLLDTGTDRVVLFGGNFANLGWLELRRTSQSASSLGVQDAPVQVFSAPDIILGGQHFSEDRAYFVPEGADPAFDGLLGVRALGFRVLSYDQTSGAIYLQK